MKHGNLRLQGANSDDRLIDRWGSTQSYVASCLTRTRFS